MRQIGKRIGKSGIAFLAGAALLCLLPAYPAFAAGGAYVSDSYLQIAEGETAYVSLTADNAAGSYVVSSDGPISAGGGGWIENESATISIKGTGTGTGTVTITFTTLATFDDENLDGTSLTVEVEVGADGNYNGGDKGGDQEKNGTGDDAETETEEETEAPKPATKRSVTINNKQYTLLNNLKGVKIPEGFETKEITWKGEKIVVLTYGEELVLYVLQRDEDGKVIFREYDEDSKTFRAPRTVRQNKIVYYILDAKEGENPPEHLLERELTVNDFKVKGYVSDEKELSDLVYLRALAEGEEGIYTFDQKQGSIQRCLTFDPAPQKELSSELEKTKKELQKAQKDLKLLKILLIVAAVLIIGLVVALILILLRAKKNRPKLNDLYPETGEDEFEFPQEQEDADLSEIRPQEEPELDLNDDDFIDLDI